MGEAWSKVRLFCAKHRSFFNDIWLKTIIHYDRWKIITVHYSEQWAPSLAPRVVHQKHENALARMFSFTIGHASGHWTFYALVYGQLDDSIYGGIKVTRFKDDEQAASRCQCFATHLNECSAVTVRCITKQDTSLDLDLNNARGVLALERLRFQCYYFICNENTTYNEQLTQTRPKSVSNYLLIKANVTKPNSIFN